MRVLRCYLNGTCGKEDEGLKNVIAWLTNNAELTVTSNALNWPPRGSFMVSYKTTPIPPDEDMIFWTACGNMRIADQYPVVLRRMPPTTFDDREVVREAHKMRRLYADTVREQNIILDTSQACRMPRWHQVADCCIRELGPMPGNGHCPTWHAETDRVLTTLALVGVEFRSRRIPFMVRWVYEDHVDQYDYDEEPDGIDLFGPTVFWTLTDLGMHAWVAVSGRPGAQ